jgi:AcrR family transcriptional regulator
MIDSAIRIADAEGLDAVSMRRLASALGVGTMSLYRYVSGKLELHDLMLDRVQASSDHWITAGDDWRTALECFALERLSRFRRHPWVLDIDRTRPVVGPGAAGAMENVLSRIKPTGLSDSQLTSAIVMIDNYVTGAARTYISVHANNGKRGVASDRFWDVCGAASEEAVDTGRYPAQAALSARVFNSPFDHFVFGLERILDGMDRLVEQDKN